MAHLGCGGDRRGIAQIGQLAHHRFPGLSHICAHVIELQIQIDVGSHQGNQCSGYQSGL